MIIEGEIYHWITEQKILIVFLKTQIVNIFPAMQEWNILIVFFVIVPYIHMKNVWANRNTLKKMEGKSKIVPTAHFHTSRRIMKVLSACCDNKRWATVQEPCMYRVKVHQR